jgi:peptidoglycan/xylan/chitin deacetylase (PgdA/CDA1 family)
MRRPARGLLALLAAALLGAGVQSPGEAGGLPPNELGRVIVLVYHRVGGAEARWTRSPEHLREDLQRLWDGGYRLAALADLVRGRVAVPAGTSPVVLTFDDSSAGQFRYLDGAEGPVLDPDCAVGVLEAFERTHPEFGHAATFYVLPAADPPNRLFDQPALATRKLRYLVSRGYEIGNHTLWHANLSRYPEPIVRRQLAGAVEWIQRHVPGYEPRTLALPMGEYPSVLEWAVAGQVGPWRYRHDAIVRVSGGAAPSPHARAFDAYRLPRIQATGDAVLWWIRHFDRAPEERYVSDGDPGTVTVPRGSAGRVRPDPALEVVERP